MALQSIIPGGYFPLPLVGAANLWNFDNMLLNASGEKAAYICSAPFTGNITAVAFRVGTSTTGDTVDVRVETIDASGDPSGTLFGANTNGAQVVSTSNNQWYLTTLTSPAAVTKGDRIAIVVVQGAGGGDFNVQRFQGANVIANVYSDHDTAGWTKGTSQMPIGALSYGGTYYNTLGVHPWSGRGAVAFGSGSSPDERGMIFNTPFSLRVTGAVMHGDFDNACDVVLYDTDGSTVLATAPVISAERQINGKAGQFIELPANYVLKPDADYRIVVKPTTAGTVILDDITVPSAAYLDAMDCGQQFRMTQRTNAGAWTDTATKRPMISLIADAFPKTPWMNRP